MASVGSSRHPLSRHIAPLWKSKNGKVILSIIGCDLATGFLKLGDQLPPQETESELD